MAPFGNLLRLDGPHRRSRSRHVLEQQFVAASTGVARSYLALGVSEGFAYTWDDSRNAGDQGHRVIDDPQRRADEPGHDLPRLGTLNFLANGGDSFTGFAAGTNRPRRRGGPGEPGGVLRGQPGAVRTGRPRRPVSDRHAPRPVGRGAAPHPGVRPLAVSRRGPAYGDAMQPRPPTPERRPHVREHHGHRSDPYAWMRDLEDPALLAHLEAENTYAEARTEHLAPLRATMVEEITLAGEGDRPVGARRERAVVVLRAHRRGPASTPPRCASPAAPTRPCARGPRGAVRAGRAGRRRRQRRGGRQRVLSRSARSPSAPTTASSRSRSTPPVTSGSTSRSATSPPARCSTP